MTQRGVNAEGLKEVGADRAAEGAGGVSDSGYVEFGVHGIAGDAADGMGALLIGANPTLGSGGSIGVGDELD